MQQAVDSASVDDITAYYMDCGERIRVDNGAVGKLVLMKQRKELAQYRLTITDDSSVHHGGATADNFDEIAFALHTFLYYNEIRKAYIKVVEDKQYLRSVKDVFEQLRDGETIHAGSLIIRVEN